MARRSSDDRNGSLAVSALSLGEGHTPLEPDPELARWGGLAELWVKREDTNPTGSHKDRGAVVQIAACVAQGRRVAVISSSGNAALAAATYGRHAGVAVVALLSPMSEPARVALLRASGARVVVTTKPINYGLRLSRVRRWPDLRPSQSAEAVRGFRTLGEELAAELRPGAAVFGYASSGATYAALGAVFAERGSRWPLHPVQAGLVNGISREFGRPGDGRRSVVGDLGVKVSDRAATVAQMVRTSGGQAWWVDDEAITAAGEALKNRGYDLAVECWAALAGVAAARAAAGVDRACLVLTGRAVRNDPATSEPGGLGTLNRPAEAFDEVLALVEDLQ
jgi:threonine synthase